MDGRKRSADPSSPSLGPPKKKYGTDSSEPGDPKMEILQVHNRAMLIRIEELKSEIQVLGSRVRSFETKQVHHDEELSVVHRVWTRLQEDLRLVLARIGPDAADLALPSPNSAVSAGLLGQLCQYQQTMHPESANDADSLLLRRASDTHRLLTSVVDAIERERSRADQLSGTLAASLNAGGDGHWQAVLDGNERLRHLNSQLSSGNDQLIVRHKQLSDQLAETEQQRAALQQHVDDLREQMLQLRDTLEDTVRRTTKQQVKLTDDINRLRDQRANGDFGTESGSSPGVGRHQQQQPHEHAADSANGNSRALEDSLQEKQRLLDSRAELISRLQDERKTLALEYEKLRATVNNPSPDIVQRHRLYLSTHQHMQHYENETKLSRAAFDKLQAQYDTLVKESRGDLDKAQATCARLNDQLERDAKDYEAKLAAARSEREQMARQLELQKAQGGGPQQIVAELRTTIASRDAELKRMKDLQATHKADSDQLKAQLAESRRAQDRLLDQLDAKRGESERLKRKADDADKQLEQLNRQRQQAKGRERELTSALDALQASHTDKRELRDIRVSERKLLDECAELQARFTVEKDKREKLQAQLEARDEQLRGEAAERQAQLERSVRDLQADLDAKDHEIEALMGEIENISKIFEELQDQKDRVMQQLSDREDAFQKLMTEQIKASQTQSLLKKEKDAVVERMKTFEDKYARLDDVLQKMDAKLKMTTEQARKYGDDLRLSSAMTEGYKRQSRDAQAFGNDCKLQMERLEKELDDMRRRCEDKVRSYEAELGRNDRLEEQMSVLKRKLEKQQTKLEPSSSEKPDVLLQEEVKVLRRQTTCFVCNDRPKDSVIARCFHMFCRQCLQRNLEIRHRKCPACSEPFGHNDVHTVYFS
eukprot:TRINITY_DN26596_c0_g1_i1.p1 TRINITY_DN26596_c0_g1~~TRINITY_DN26596_c0_g1_i1.p1  ORF type:complete len:884 (-),score=328.98 TRINITY_DN26596_c0_g1_i1:270-2921(-)